MEVQIRTQEMNRLAEYGIAAHWLYKSRGVSADSLDARLMWVRQALERNSFIALNKRSILLL